MHPTIHPEASNHAVQLIEVLAKEKEGSADSPSTQFWRQKQAKAGQGEYHVNAANDVGSNERELGQRKRLYGKQGQGTRDEHAEGSLF